MPIPPSATDSTPKAGTRHHYSAVPSIGSGRCIAIGAGILVVIGLGTWVDSGGAIMEIKTNVSGALIQLDSQGTNAPSGEAEFSRIPFGDRHITISHRDYQTVSTM